MSDNKKNNENTRVYLKYYKPYAFLIKKTELIFQLDKIATRVRSKIWFEPNPLADPTATLELDGNGLQLISAKIDGEAVTPTLDEKGLSVSCPMAPFLWEAEVEINPSTNTHLSGLYISNAMYCTQCEPEGFRCITYYPDRPDVMAPFSVRIESDKSVLLSNGNPGETGAGWAEWHDPWPKPSYLFALVAADLQAHSGTFRTKTGRDIALNIWVEPKDLGKCAFALEALQRAMRWDEQVYERIYDLDVFNIVAVDDFNMGAMENKGLNIFNSAAVLANAETSTDVAFARIEAIIAHEYFHNWTGNRITCRDWFQLCLKEGLTVFRDQQFSADMRSESVQRIEDVLDLRQRQFPEDNGPLAHPVRPESFVEINNFYTATVYEKGAELIRVLHQIVGPKIYAEALALYFQRHDGQACTIEDWLKVFEDVTGQNLTQFMRWYSDAGTPELRATVIKEGSDTILRLSQSLPDKAKYEPRVIPVSLGFVTQDGQNISQSTVVLDQLEADFHFADIPPHSVPSLLRGFSAPVHLVHPKSSDDLLCLLAHDNDPFNRWQAGQNLLEENLIERIEGKSGSVTALTSALKPVICNENLDPAFRALLLTLPNEADMAQKIARIGQQVDPQKIHLMCKALRCDIANDLASVFEELYRQLETSPPYDPSAVPAGRRKLRHTILSYLSEIHGLEHAEKLFTQAQNMTETLAALSVLITHGKAEKRLAAFYQSWAHERLVIDKWFALQVLHAAPNTLAQTVKKLSQHPDFSYKSPNRFRAVFQAMAQNHAGFHHASGESYKAMAQALIHLDTINPQVAARLSTAFESWRLYPEAQQNAVKAALESIAQKENLSKDLGEMIARLRQ